MTRADKVSFWVSVALATVAVTILGFQLAAADLAVSTFVFVVVTSWLGLYFSLDHLYAVVRRAKADAR